MKTFITSVFTRCIKVREYIFVGGLRRGEKEVNFDVEQQSRWTQMDVDYSEGGLIKGCSEVKMEKTMDSREGAVRKGWT